MEHIAIEAKPRHADASKGERKRLRRAGHIPGAVFGKGIEGVLVTVEARDVAKVLASDAGANTLIDLSLGGDRHLVKLTEVEINPLTRDFQHVGLHKIQANEAQKATVPVELTGEPESVRLNEGLLDQAHLTIEVKALPERMVANLFLDVSEMQIGDVKYASDVELPSGIELVSALDTVIVSVKVARELVTDTEIENELQEGTGPSPDSSSPEEALQNV
ncbi:MAG: 50S ribosomal protein L25 [Cytophagales bacterium]|nr:50S ribosomal protein L25 [Armatimonadota bacterium]